MGYMIGIISGFILGMLGTLLLMKGEVYTAIVVFGTLFFAIGYNLSELIR
jgi:hypothetical protein